MSVISKQAGLKVAEDALIHGSDFNLKEVARPKGMLEHLVNMFTLGGVKSEKKMLYHSTVQALHDRLHEKNITIDKVHEAGTIVFRANKMDITLEPKAAPGEMLVTVEKGGEKKSEYVTNSNFTSLCTSILVREKLGLNKDNNLLTPTGKIDLRDLDDTCLTESEVVDVLRSIPKETDYYVSNKFFPHSTAIQIREKLGLSEHKDLLMPSGEINLTDIHETKLDLIGVANILKGLPSQIKWILSKEYVDNISNVLKYSESLEKNHNTKPFVSGEPELQINISPKTAIHNDALSSVASWETTGADSDVATGYMIGTNSDSDTLSIDSLYYEKKDLYNNPQNRKNFLAARFNTPFATKA